MNDIINLQRKIQFDTLSFRKYVDGLSASVAESDGRKFSVAFIGDSRMKQLNELFRGL